MAAADKARTAATAVLTGAHAVKVPDQFKGLLNTGYPFPYSMPYYICRVTLGNGVVTQAYVFDREHALLPAEHAHEPIVALEVL